MSELRSLQDYLKGLAEEETRESREADGPTVSEERTPYMVKCPTHGEVYLTAKGYNKQMMAADSLWVCPHCGLHSSWSDENYESYYEEEEMTDV